MKKQYSVEFKIEAVKRLEKTGESLSKVVRELGASYLYKNLENKRVTSEITLKFLTIPSFEERDRNEKSN